MHILIVDDDDVLLKLIQLHIEHEGYTTLVASDGREALEVLEQHSTEIQAIVSDVKMPTMDGYELCKAIRNTPATEAIPFIFLSNLSTLEEKLTGYAAGADDYIPKPINPNDFKELLIKIDHAIQTRIKHDALSQQLTASTKMAFQAMGYSSCLGQVLQFMQNTANTLSFEQLAEDVFKTTQEFGLNCIIQFNAADGALHFSSKGKISPLEKNIIELLNKNDQRFYDFGARTAINYPSFCLLAKNMPIDDEERYGMLKDVLGNFCEAVHARAQYIHHHGINEKRKTIITSVNESIQNIELSFKTIQADNLYAVEYLRDELEEAMITLSLTEVQEESVRKTVQVCYDKINTIFHDGSVLNMELEKIRSTLNAEWSK